MHDRFLSRHIADTRKYKYKRVTESSSLKNTQSSNPRTPAKQEEILQHVKDSLDTWTALANTAGAVTTGATIMPATGDMQRASEYVQEGEASQKGYGALIGLLLTITAAFIWYVRKRSQEKKEFGEVKKELNAWYSRFSVASQACQDIATIAFSFLPSVFSPFKRMISYITGTIAGCLVVALVRPSDQDNFLYTLGKSEGWSSYMFTGSSIGAMVGGAVGAIIGLLIPLPFTMPACIALFSAVGGLTGAIATGIGVPVINKIFPDSNPKYRMNYAKTGALFGSTIGGIIGFVVGFFIPLPGAVIACTTIGMGIGAAIGSIVLAATGPSITKKIDEKEDSVWDFSARYAGTIGNGLGTAIGFGIERIQEGSQQLAANIGTLITSGIGLCYNLWTTYKQKNAPASSDSAPKEKKSVVPWHQRLNIFAAVGTTIGSVVGFFIGGPVGMVIGGAIGAVVGAGIGIAAGNAICKTVTKFANWIANKVDSQCCSKNEETPAATLQDKNNKECAKKMSDSSTSVIYKVVDPLIEKQALAISTATVGSSAPIAIPTRKNVTIVEEQPSFSPCQSAFSANGMWAHQASTDSQFSQSCPSFNNRIRVQ